MKRYDSATLVLAENFPYAKFSYPEFNPVQSSVFEFYQNDEHALIASLPNTGKSTISEMYLSHEVRKRGGKGMYLSPLRALSREKVTSNHFDDLKVSICTGDYRLTADRLKEIEEADILFFTTELLNSRCRNYAKSKFLDKVKTLIIDECHTIGDPARGSHLEAGIMKFTEINPDARIIMLSGTIPNPEDLTGWLEKITGKPVNLLVSSFRPLPLHIHYERYYAEGSYDNQEEEKIRAALNIYDKQPEHKFLFFVHTKRTGRMLESCLKKKGVSCAFHHGDLGGGERAAMENRFREDKSFRALVATNTLAAGINCPARCVVIVGVHRGQSLVEQHEIAQQCGRSGRVGYDTQGDAYILLPHKDFAKHRYRVSTPVSIQSQLHEDNLPFHILSEMHHRNIQSATDVMDWYERSFAYHQGKRMDEEEADNLVKKLVRCGAAKEEEGVYEATTIGSISSMYYYSPFDIADLSRQLTRLFSAGKQVNDLYLATALANLDSNKTGIASAADKSEMSTFVYQLNNTAAERILNNGKAFSDGVLKTACCYYNLLNGYESADLGGTMRGLLNDYGRLQEVIVALDSMVGKWKAKDFFQKVALRLKHGVSGEIADFCQLVGIGKVKAQKLYDAGLRSLTDLTPNKMREALRCSETKAQEWCEEASKL